VTDCAAPPVLRHSIYSDDEQTIIGDLLIRRQGDSVELNCDVIAGIPAPVITWSKDGSDVVANQPTDEAVRGATTLGNGNAGRRRVAVDGTRLIVSDLRPSDGGLYRCTAKNVVGHDEQVFRLVIEGE
jgi:Immunoglobulin domain